MMQTARNLTFEVREIEYVCADCGKTVRFSTQVPVTIGKVCFDRCDDCAESLIRKRGDDALANAWRKRSEASGIPMGFIDWDRSRGNLDLMSFIWHNQHKSLFIVDDYGTGKSRAMAAAAVKMLRDDPGLRVAFWSFPDLLAKYSSLMQESMRKAENFKRDMESVNLLIIDDIGKKKITDSGSDFLYWIVNRRYETRRTMWLSANLTGNQLSKKFPDADTANAIFDRLRRMMDDGDMMRWEAGKGLGK